MNKMWLFYPSILSSMMNNTYYQLYDELLKLNYLIKMIETFDYYCTLRYHTEFIHYLLTYVTYVYIYFLYLILYFI